MDDKEFKQIIKEGKGCAVIMAGSGSDKDHIEKIIKSLKEYEVPHQVRICSAHKQPDMLIEILNGYNEMDGSFSIISIAGGTDALSGTASFHALGPVISCPPDTKYADKEKYQNDFNESCLQNPPGSSNAYVGRADNIGKYIAQTYAGINPRFRELLLEKNASKIKCLEDADKEFQLKFGV